MGSTTTGDGTPPRPVGGPWPPRAKNAPSRNRREVPAESFPETGIPGEEASGVRLQKVLAQAGIGSRRSCEELIADGRVSVDGETARLGHRVDAQQQVIRVDGLRINVRTNQVYLALNKPRGVVTTMVDPQGRPTVAEYVVDREERLFHVGRLDTDTEGVLLLTNDGELAHRLTHPSYGVTKTYLAEVSGPLGRDVGQRLRDGVELEDGPATADNFRAVQSHGDRVMVELVLHEGRNHIVRRMMDAVGHPVRRLVRTSFGSVQLGNLRPGQLRHLTQHEIGALYKAAEL